MGRPIYLPVFEKHPDEVADLSLILSPWLDQFGVDRTINAVGTPVIIKGPDANLTIANETKNNSTYTSQKDGSSHVAGTVIQCTISAGTSDSRYEVKFPFTLNEGNSQTYVAILPVYVI